MKQNQQENTETNNQELIFKSIYEKYYSELCLYARKFVADDEEAEEIVQNIIVKLWDQKDRINEIQSISSYLFRFVRNHCLNYIKHQKYIDAYKDSSWIELKRIETEQYTELTNFEIQKQVIDAIEALPERCREVFEMSRFDGLKYKEIADQLGITVKAVEANISRALTSLRKSLKEYLLIDMLIISIFFIAKHIGEFSNLLS